MTDKASSALENCEVNGIGDHTCTSIDANQSQITCGDYWLG